MKSRGLLAVAVAASLTALAPAAALAAPTGTSLDAALEELEALAPEEIAPTGDESDLVSLAGDAGAFADSVSSAGAGAALQAVEDFPDCSPSDWYAEFVTYVSDNGLITGRADGTFAPAADVSRGDLVTILWRMAGEPTVTAVGFPDLNANDYFRQAALWAQRNNIVGGVTHEDGELYFDGARAITREECAVMLARYADYCDEDVSSDKSALQAIPGWQSASSWALDGLGWVVDKGLMSGQGDGSGLDPQGTTSRAAMAKMITVLHRDVLGEGGSSVETPQAEAEKVVLKALQEIADDLNASQTSGYWSANIADFDSPEMGRAFFVTLHSDLPFSVVRAAYQMGGELLLSIDEMATSMDDLSGTIYDLSVSQGAGLNAVVAMFSSDGEVIHSSMNGDYLVPYWYSLR